LLQIHIRYYCCRVRLYKHTKKFNLIPKEINLCRKIGGESSHYRYISFDYVSVHIIVQECTAYFMLKKIFLRYFLPRVSVLRQGLATDAHVFNRKFYRANASLAFTYITRALQFIRAFFPSMHTNWIRP